MLIIDTNVVSELRLRDRANRNVLDWADRADLPTFYLSCITLLELEYGALLLARKDPPQGERLRRWIYGELMPGFAGRILPVDTEIALRCASLRVPDPRSERDSLIAATALVHGMAVVTRNVRDFEPMGVKVFNPWEAA